MVTGRETTYVFRRFAHEKWLPRSSHPEAATPGRFDDVCEVLDAQAVGPITGRLPVLYNIIVRTCTEIAEGENQALCTTISSVTSIFHISI